MSVAVKEMAIKVDVLSLVIYRLHVLVMPTKLRKTIDNKLARFVWDTNPAALPAMLPETMAAWPSPPGPPAAGSLS